MGDVNRAIGGGSELEFEGKVYKLSPWTYKIQASYERYLEKEAFESLKRLKAYLTTEEYMSQLNRLQQDITVGVYSFGSDQVAKSFTSIPHIKQILFLMIKENHPEITKDLVDKIADKKFDEIMMKLGEANADPTNSENVLTNPI